MAAVNSLLARQLFGCGQMQAAARVSKHMSGQSGVREGGGGYAALPMHGQPEIVGLG